MNTRQRILLASTVLLCALTLRTEANPNHLEPIRAYDDTGYDEAVFKSLIGEASASLWMIERPSFLREYGVILRREVEYDPNDTRPAPLRRVTREQWFVVYATPKEMIWRWKRVDSYSETLDIKPTKDVETQCIPVTRDFAQIVEKAWWNVLQLTRVPKDRFHGLDGTTLQFCCGYLSGETWSPKTGLPAMLADLGRKLGTLARSDETERGRLLAEAESLARKIAKEAEAEQVKRFGRKMN